MGVGVLLGNITCLLEIIPRSRLHSTSDAIENGAILELSCRNVASYCELNIAIAGLAWPCNLILS